MKHADYLHEDRRRNGELFAGQTFSGITGTMAAALASGAHVINLRYPLAALGKFEVTWLHLHYVTIVAYTTPVTAGRRLALRRGSGADSSGGAALDVSRNQSTQTGTLLTGNISTTAALTVTNITLETEVRERFMLVQAGNAGNDYDEIWMPTPGERLILNPGQCLAIVAGQAFDAAGTWQLTIKGGGREILP